jgi:hypothetical protein
VVVVATIGVRLYKVMDTQPRPVLGKREKVVTVEKGDAVVANNLDGEVVGDEDDEDSEEGL